MDLEPSLEDHKSSAVLYPQLTLMNYYPFGWIILALLMFQIKVGHDGDFTAGFGLGGGFLFNSHTAKGLALWALLTLNPLIHVDLDCYLSSSQGLVL